MCAALSQVGNVLAAIEHQQCIEMATKFNSKQMQFQLHMNAPWHTHSSVHADFEKLFSWFLKSLPIYSNFLKLLWACKGVWRQCMRCWTTPNWNILSPWERERERGGEPVEVQFISVLVSWVVFSQVVLHVRVWAVRFGNQWTPLHPQREQTFPTLMR